MDSKTKRRRGLGVVTPNACTECRKKRAKCSGGTPCVRCAAQKNLDCIYEIPVRTSKEHMRTEIEQLRTQNQYNEKLLAALVSNDDSSVILEQLRGGEPIESVLGMLELNGTVEKGKGKEKEKEEEDEGMKADSASPVGNVTTYSRPGYSKAILSAVKLSRSEASSPPSTIAFSDTNQSSHKPGNWLPWGGEDEPGTSAQSGKLRDGDDFMKWSPRSTPNQDIGFPLVGTWYHQSDSQSAPDSRTQSMRAQGRETMLGHQFGTGEQGNCALRWTEASSDETLVEHLMALYFCWEYPTFASLNKEHFLEDFRVGERRHCSSLLVNAILAVGARFSSQSAARTDPDDRNTAGNHFFAEALRLLEQEVDRHNVTTIQALGLMSIREAGCGRTSEAIYFSGQSIKLAVEMGLHLDSENGVGDSTSLEHAVRSATFWGAFALDQCWSLSIGRLPQFSRDTKLLPTPAIVDEIEASEWIPYTDDGDDLSRERWQRQLTSAIGAPLERNCTQPSNVRSVYKTFCELSEIVHTSLYAFYTPGNPLTSKTLLQIYSKYLNWYDAIPDTLRLGYNFTPAVLFAHMYYHYAILLLFRPFIKLDIIGSGVSPQDVCGQASDAIQALTKSYSQLYTLRRTPSFVPYFVLTSTIAHLVTHGSGRSGPQQLTQGIADLTEMTRSHGFAVRAREILVFLAAYWGVEVEWTDGDGRDHKALCRPRSNSMNKFSPNIENLELKSTFRLGTEEKEGEEENPLFWPFPMQGKPMLGLGPLLREAGFLIRRVEQGQSQGQL